MEDATPQELLDAVYTELGYAEGAPGKCPLYGGSDNPDDFSPKDWIEKGEWLSLTKDVGAEKILFVDNNPVAVFAKSDVNESETLRKIYNKIWCMSRPRFLFLSRPGELAVYDLANQPTRSVDEWKKISPLGVVQKANEVAEKLKAFRREQIETGQLFSEELLFGNLKNRADKALIRDLKEVRKALMEEGLKDEKVKYAHALIGRSIFIRYLEDRKILLPEDFKEVASKKKLWMEILENDVPRAGLNLSDVDSLYARVLSDKAFTFAVFEKLAKDFNGDMFPGIKKEKEIITQDHLHLIQNLLFGNVGEQYLFFYAYKFQIIPLDLISSIYEEFYHPESKKGKEKKSSEGAYYTPPALVEFLLNQILTPECLSQQPKPRILDPACGSGIFIVESFRRIVRHRMLELKKKPSFQNLQKILREQIAGIEINPEAIRITAFSLYLAMLHYLDPPSIREQVYERGNRLPNLVFDEENPKEKSLNILLAQNAFDSDYIGERQMLKDVFSPECVDVVVGNPPWGSPGSKKKDQEARKENKVAMQWCANNNLPVGDQERSQAFIWRALNLLRPGGVCGLLVSTGVFFKHHEKSVEFRKKWLTNSKLLKVYNFSHTRKVFFSGADSPFAAIVFSKEAPTGGLISYWISRKISIIENLVSVVFYKNDLRLLPLEANELVNHQTWKIFWWGNQHDKSLIDVLKQCPAIYKFSDEELIGQGYKKATQKDDCKWLKNYRELPIECFERYGKIKSSLFVNPPAKVERRGVREIYDGNRLLVKRGIQEKGSPKGQIVARLEEKPFCFTNAIHGIKLKNRPLWQYKIILGILWSSLARYYFFLTTSNWGIWHHEIQLEEELMQLPIRLPEELILRKRIITIVDKLRQYDPPVKSIQNQKGETENEILKERQQYEKELDKAIFELYELDEREIDLINDMCEVTLPYYYSPEDSLAGKPFLKDRLLCSCGNIEMLPKNPHVADYIRIFCQSWCAYLDEGTEFHWQVYLPNKTDSMMAVVFSIHKTGEKCKADSTSWDEILTQLEGNLTQPFYSSQIYIEGMVRGVTDNSIIIVKRNELRLWTRSMAREDAEATLVQAMNRKIVIH